MTYASVNDVIERLILPNEGGYVNDSRDAGGETNWGITVATARSQGYSGAMRDMPRSFAVEVYRRLYAIAPGFDMIFAQDAGVGALLIDIGVNMGPAVAGTFLQRCLNALNNGGKDYSDLVLDGGCGPKTRGALAAYLAKRGKPGGAVLAAAIKGLRTERYVALCEARGANEAFAYGWLTRAAA